MSGESKYATDYLHVNKHHQLDCNKKLLSHLKIKPNFNVLEIGCGTGETAAFIAENELSEAGNVTAFDPDIERIRIARERFSDIPRLSFINGLASEYLTDQNESYDLIYSVLVLQWMSDTELETTIKQTFQALKKGAMSAHIIAAAVPPSMRGVADLLPAEKRTEFSDLFRPIRPAKFRLLAEDLGFQVLEICDYPKPSSFPTTDSYLTWLDATFHGRFKFKELWNSAGEKPALEMFEDGSIKHYATLFFVLLQKP